MAEARETYSGDLAVAVAGVPYDVGSPFTAPLAVSRGVAAAGYGQPAGPTRRRMPAPAVHGR